jgi:hypothetical protein
MINLEKLNKKAIKILDDNVHLIRNWENKDFQEAYKDFMKETDFEYKDLGFNGFQVAMKRYKTAKKRKQLLSQHMHHPKHCTYDKYVEHKRREAVEELYE